MRRVTSMPARLSARQNADDDTKAPNEVGRKPSIAHNEHASTLVELGSVGKTPIRRAYSTDRFSLKATIRGHVSFSEIMEDWVSTMPESHLEIQRKITHAYELGDIELDLRDQNLTSLPECLHMLTSLEELRVDKNKLLTIPKLPKSLKKLYADRNHIRLLSDDMPANLEVLSVSDNAMIEVGNLPSTLRELRISGNKIRELPNLTLTPRLEHLDASKNLIKTIHYLPKGIKKLSVWNNRLNKIPVIPASVIELDISDNPLIDVPPKLLYKLEHDLSVAERIQAISSVRKWQSSLPD